MEHNWYFITLGGLLLLDTLALLPLTNGNLGIYLPAIMGLPLLCVGFFYGWFRAWTTHGFGSAVKWILLCGYGAAVLFFALGSLFLYVQGRERPQDAPADALVVLGCGIRGERPSLTLARRLDRAVAYLEEHPQTVCFVSGGQGSGEFIPEGEAMRRYLVGRGIDEARIVCECASMSTQENFRFTRPLIEARCGKNARILYVTTDFHIYRAGRVAAAEGVSARGLASKSLWYIAPNNYMRECVAVTAYKLLGRF